MASGTQGTDIDICGADTCGSELRDIGLAQVKMHVFRWWLVPGRLHVEPLNRIRFVTGPRFVKIFSGVGKLRCEFGDEFNANFIAARTDCRTNCHDQIAGLLPNSWIMRPTDFSAIRARVPRHPA